MLFLGNNLPPKLLSTPFCGCCFWSISDTGRYLQSWGLEYFFLHHLPNSKIKNWRSTRAQPPLWRALYKRLPIAQRLVLSNARNAIFCPTPVGPTPPPLHWVGPYLLDRFGVIELHCFRVTGGTATSVVARQGSWLPQSYLFKDSYKSGEVTLGLQCPE